MSVDIKNLAACIFEARRFLKKAETALRDLEEEDRTMSLDAMDPKRYWHDGRLTAAARRSSMDLTRTLAALRDYRR